MKISTQATKYINEHYKSAGDPARSGVAELVKKIGAQLGAVEESYDFGTRYQGALVVRVVTCVPHVDSDHLNICHIDDGGVVKGLERDTDGLVQVVCGAPNVRAGMLAVWLPPGSTVPESYDKEPFVLSSREFRGVMSNGMMASPRELALSDAHEGILEITEDHKPGTSFAEANHLVGDTIIDIENKMFTHRPDCFGWLGIAREIEGIHQRKYKSPKWYTVNPIFPKPESKELPLTIVNEIPKLVPRFVAITMSDIKVGPSPLWLQVDLARVGMRSINNIVDYSNFYMLLTGQPIHIYDYDKVKELSGGDATLTVRYPKEGEKIELLNGKAIQPRGEAMVVAVGDTLACLGGAMGGANTEVDEHTTNIIIEAANWDMYNMRRTSMTHGIFTDAVTRFTKGQSPLQNLAVVSKIVEAIRKDGGKVAGKIIDDNHLPKSMLERGSVYLPVHTTAEFINSRLGSNFSKQEIAKLLSNVEFDVVITGNELSITAPFWRTDIEIPEDVVEEVGRLHGYDGLPHELPDRSTAPTKLRKMDVLKDKIRATLSAAGANELQTYSFVPAKLLQDVGQEPKHAFSIRNALSPELQHYRLSLTPSLLEKVHPNIKAGYTTHALYEMNKVHIKGDEDCDGLPREYKTLAFVYASSDDIAGAAFYQAKYYLELLLQNLNIPYVILPVDKPSPFEIGRQIFAPFETTRAAYLLVGNDLAFGGFVGEYNARTRKNLKLPKNAAGFELDLDKLKQNQQQSQYQQLLKFPATVQDVCFKVANTVQYMELYQHVAKSFEGDERLRVTLSPVDIYQRQDDAEHKQITLRIALQHLDKTLTSAESNQLIEAMVADVTKRLHAERV